MKQYNVYAIGTALIDLQYQLNFMRDLGVHLDPGGTNLLNQEQEEQLSNRLSDIAPMQSCGGSSGNTLSVTRSLGGKVFCTCKVGPDAAGDYYYRDLREQNIETSLATCARAEARTGKCIIAILPDADRVLNSFFGANAFITLDDINQSALKNSQYLFIESFLSIAPQSKATIIAVKKIAKAAGCKIVLTFTTCRPPDITRENLISMVDDGVDLLFCNEFEAKYYCDSNDLEIIKEKLKSAAKQFVITLGKQGALLYDGMRFHEVSGYPVTPIDTTGAGDVFCGAFLYAITHGSSFVQAGDFACYAASKVVTHYGARLKKSAYAEIAQHFELALS